MGQPSLPNAERLVQALTTFGVPLGRDGITPATFTRETIYRIGVAPVMVDIRTHITGVRFEEAWSRRVESSFLGVPVNVLSLADIIRNKQAVGYNIDHDEQLAYLFRREPHRGKPSGGLGR